jgi:hypothetical protein
MDTIPIATIHSDIPRNRHNLLAMRPLAVSRMPKLPLIVRVAP